MQSIMRKSIQQGLFILLGSALFGCSSADNEMAGGNLQAVNHTVHGINWMSVNGYRADGGGGASCCIIMPTKWRPGLKARIEWEVDPEPNAKMPSVTSKEFREVYVRHAANYQRHSTTVDIPEWRGTESCGLEVHFLVCNKIKVTTACWGYGSPHNPIKEPLHMKEPAVCPK
ncbi:DUF3304 domain-containing protein [Pseudomonas syringae group genomosp. 3]|uniref:DUF3304 domain-containing protein n=1 Tax=Pseudomonas syringae group genomosp. 3 TaxID=251701 RepID=UPI0005CB3A23|nr:DUF3304 domain-containing protein [Pseudomonas syringae group genomosp. 3]